MTSLLLDFRSRCWQERVCIVVYAAGLALVATLAGWAWMV